MLVLVHSMFGARSTVHSPSCPLGQESGRRRGYVHEEIADHDLTTRTAELRQQGYAVTHAPCTKEN